MKLVKVLLQKFLTPVRTNNLLENKSIFWVDVLGTELIEKVLCGSRVHVHLGKYTQLVEMPRVSEVAERILHLHQRRPAVSE